MGKHPSLFCSSISDQEKKVFQHRQQFSHRPPDQLQVHLGRLRLPELQRQGHNSIRPNQPLK
jgi:hypothetical protein